MVKRHEIVEKLIKLETMEEIINAFQNNEIGAELAG